MTNHASRNRFILFCLGLITLLLAATMMPISAQTATSAQPTDGLVFTLNADNASYSITGYTGTSTEIVIPSTYQGLPVTSIDDGCFPVFFPTFSENEGTVLPEDFFDAQFGAAPEKITIYAKNIHIPDSPSVFPKNAVIYGYAGSTAQAYAEKYGLSFVNNPSIVTANIQLGADITINYTVNIGSSTPENVVMRFTANEMTTTVTGFAAKADNCYTFSFKGIGPHMMGDVIRAEVLVNGVVVDTIENYSVKQYCLNMLDRIVEKNIPDYTDAQYSLLKTLIADLLQYGADAQTYAEYKTNALVNQGISGMSSYSAPSNIYASPDFSASSAPDNSYLLSAAMELSNVIRLRFSFATPNVSDVTVKIGNKEYSESDFIDSKFVDGNGFPVYWVYSEAIYATQIEDIYSVVLLVDGNECQTLSYGVLNYVYRKQNDTDTTLASLVRSIRNYGRAALGLVEYVDRSGTAALYVANENLTYVNDLYRSLQSKFEQVDLKSASDSTSSIFNTAKYDLVVVAGVDTMSPSATAAMDTYLNNNGRVLLLGGPALEKPFLLNGEHMTLDTYRESVINTLPSTNKQIVFNATTTSGLSAIKSGGAITRTVGNYGLSNSTNQLYFKISDLTNYAYLERNNIAVRLTDANALSFYAKAGDDKTNVFTIEIKDWDENLWRTKVALSNEWKHYTFLEEDFAFRGSGVLSSDTLDFTNIQSIKIAFEMSFSKISAGEHSLYVSDLMLSNVQEDSAFASRNEQIIFNSSNVSGMGQEVSSGSTITKTVDDYGLGKGEQLYFAVDYLSNHAVIKQTGINVTMSDATNLSFYAKAGDTRTNVFTLEIHNATGTIWRTKVRLSSTWQHYSFQTDDFVFRSGDSTAALDFKNIKTVKLAFETSYSQISQGAHSLYISDIVLSDVISTVDLISQRQYALNGIAPLYEQYPITNAADISADANQVFVSDRNYVIPTGTNALVSRYPGTTGVGYDKDTDIRFIPLLTVTDAKGLVSGYAAWIDLYATQTAANGSREGSMVGYFGATTDEFYNADGIAAVVEAATAMARNTFIVDAGTTEHTYLPEDTNIVTGIKFVTFDNNDDESNIVATISLYRGDALLAQYTSANAETAFLANSIHAIQTTYDRSMGAPDKVVATLSMDGQVIDRIEQDIHYWAPKPVAERSYIYTEDGYFKKDGKIINFFGINYYPSYLGAGPDDAAKTALNVSTSTYESFLSKGGYNPEVIINDLNRLKDIGMNAVSIQASLKHITSTNNLLDFLRICEEQGFYVDVYLGTYAYPLKNYNGSTVQTMIQKLHLHENDNLIAYDIAWEERIGSYTGDRGDALNRYIGRDHWDDEWIDWITVQYGSVSAALSAWGYPTDLTATNLVITDDMLDDTTGTYRKVVAAYYRFIDDIVSASMQENFSHLQSLAPDQLISFRMSMSGSAMRTSSLKPSTHCFDFQSLATTMDFMQPEGYELRATDESSLQIMFANAYARYTKPNSPVVWKEFGKTVWADREDGNFYPSQTSIANGANFYRSVLEYCYQSYTSGMFCWWSLPGYRANEDSDYGVYNPDGSDRGEITALLREYAPKFINQGERKDTVYIAVERDDYVGGPFGMFDAVKDELAAAYDAGKNVTFINNSQNTDGSYAYADTLLDEYVADAVSSTTGIAPLRYVNGIVKSLTTIEKNGKTYAQITVCNTKQSIWRAGTVSLVSTDDSDIKVNHTFTKDVDYLEDVTFEVELEGTGNLALRFEIADVAFGPLYATTVK